MDQLRVDLIPLKFKFKLIAQNNATIPLNNHSHLHGVLNNIIFETNPIYSRRIHTSIIVRPWTFSYLIFKEKPVKSEKKGFSKIKKNAQAYFFVKTIDPQIGNSIRKYVASHELLKISSLKVYIESLNLHIGNLHEIPREFEIVHMKLATPTFFYNADKNIIEDFTIETFLNYQCNKFKDLGIVNIKPTQLYPYLRLIQDYTRESMGYVTSKLNKGEVIGYKGKTGNISFKISGNSTEKSVIWKLIYLSGYTGIGSRTTLGFGHNFILSVQ